eukprot:s2367_g3.t1
MFRLITPDEQAAYVAMRAQTKHGAQIKNHKAKKATKHSQHFGPVQLDPDQFQLDSDHFKDDSDLPVGQIQFAEVGADQRGVALCTTTMARHFLEAPRSISTEALALLLVDTLTTDFIQSAKLKQIVIPAKCRGTNEHTLIDSTLFTVFMRIPDGALAKILTTTPMGVYAEPRGPKPQEPDQLYRAALKPGIDFVELDIECIFELFPLPHGTQRPAVSKLLSDWSWTARPLQPGRGNYQHMAWRVGASGPPPHNIMTGFNQDVVITPVKDLKQPDKPTQLITQKHLRAPPAPAASTRTGDPWMDSAQDPWAKLKPVTTSMGDHRPRLEELRDQLCHDVKMKALQQGRPFARHFNFSSAALADRDLGSGDDPCNVPEPQYFISSCDHLGLSLGTMYLPAPVQRYGEARHPGPDQGNQLTVGTFRTSSCILRKGARALNREIRFIGGSPAPLRQGSTWAGRWTGASVLSDVPAVALDIPQPLEHWHSGRVLLTRHWASSLLISIGTFYGYASGPTWPQAKQLSEQLLETFTTEMVIGMAGVRLIMGDFNREPAVFVQQQIWQRHGWQNAQHFAAEVFNNDILPTCKGLQNQTKFGFHLKPFGS